MKTNIYFNATNEMSRKDWTILRPELKDIRDEIATRHANFNEDKKASAKQFERVYKDWLNVYRMRPVNERMVKQFKGAATKKIGTSIWQKSYIEHVIRNKKDYETRSNYIFENPLRWYYDELYAEE